jgi:NADPH-dependent 2,4-dienoyl-CoA reductase/sulfur reductase-like enzyme
VTHDVVIIGAGPAGLTAARVLRAAGVRDVLVLERNPEAGGLPRFCGHLGWGMLDLRQLLSGPDYARELTRRADVTIKTDASVVGLGAGGEIAVSTREGIESIAARAVLIATGIRETPRSVRLVSGTRPWGVTTTGAFQEMIYAGHLRPFTRPMIVGSELVTFSALLTARHAGMRPVAMIEENDRITAQRPGDWIARLWFGVPVMTRTRLVEIHGRERVEAVTVLHDGATTQIACDGVIFTGRFTPEAALVRASHLALDPATGGPAIDNFARLSDPAYFAAGNVIRPVEHSGIAAREGRDAARAILRALRGELPSPDPAIPVSADGALRYVYPQRIVPHGDAQWFCGRAKQAHRGRLRLVADGRTIAARRVKALPERRLTLRAPAGTLQSVRAIECILD